MLKEPLQPRSGSPLQALSARVLGCLLAMQSVVGSLPDERSIFSFVCRGLLDVPGVKEVCYVKSSDKSTSDSLRRFPIVSGGYNLGELQVNVSDIEAFAPYESYLENFSVMVAVILEERHQRQINESHQIELEQRVQERTADLARANAALRIEVSERRRAEGEIRQRHNESETIRRIVSATATSIELPTILDQALHGALDITGLEGGTLCLVNYQHQSLDLAASVNTSPETICELTSNRIRIGDCLCGQCAKTCEPFTLWDNASGSKFATREATRSDGIRFHATFPLKAKGRCIGVLCVFGKRETKPSQRSLDLVQDLCSPIALAIENSRLFEALNRELAERKQTESELQHTNRTLHMISECDQVLVRATEEADWLHAICRIVVERGGYRLAWVGLAETDEAKTVRPMAQAGFDEGYLETVNISWADTERGRGPAGTAIRTAQPCLVRDTSTDPHFIPWRAEALKRGYASLIGLPLIAKGQTYGVLEIYAAAMDAFDRAEVKLLAELADNLAFGLASIRILAERDRLFNLSLDPLCIAGFDGYLKQVSPAWSRMLGWSESELLSRPWLDFVHPDDRATTQQTRTLLINGQSIVGFENRYRCKDGAYRWVSWNAFPLSEARMIFAVVHDVTERKRADAVLRELSQKNEEALRIAHMGHWEFDTQSGIFTFNDQYYTLHRTTAAQAGGYQMTAEEFARNYVHPHDAHLVQESIQKALASDDPAFQFQTEARILRADGEARIVFVWFRVERDAQGAVVKLLGVNQDITELKQSETALRESEALHRTILQTAMDGFYRVDMQGRLLEVNDAYCRMIGYDKEALLDIKISSLEADETPSQIMAHLQNIMARGEERFETRHRRKDGTCFPVEVSAQFKPEDGGCIIAFMRDLTERKRVEAELNRYREHLEELVANRTTDLQAANSELEAFSYSVSHDLRAPIRAINGYTHILLEDHAQCLNSEGQRVLDVICHQTGFMGQLVDDLLAFSRMGRQNMQTANIDMEGLAQEVFQEQAALNPRHTVEFKLNPLLSARGDRSMIRVILTNLLSNAFKYSRGRTPAIIEMGSIAQGVENVYFVKDNGAGFDMKYVGRLFGVFQRLHSATEFEGTGVGLALVQRIIQRHGGRVWAEAKLNEGATFYFSLRVSTPMNMDVEGAGRQSTI